MDVEAQQFRVHASGCQYYHHETQSPIVRGEAKARRNYLCSCGSEKNIKSAVGYSAFFTSFDERIMINDKTFV
jgi:hypothetical protein